MQFNESPAKRSSDKELLIMSQGFMRAANAYYRLVKKNCDKKFSKTLLKKKNIHIYTPEDYIRNQTSARKEYENNRRYIEEDIMKNEEVTDYLKIMYNGSPIGFDIYISYYDSHNLPYSRETLYILLRKNENIIKNIIKNEEYLKMKYDMVPFMWDENFLLTNFKLRINDKIYIVNLNRNRESIERLIKNITTYKECGVCYIENEKIIICEKCEKVFCMKCYYDIINKSSDDSIKCPFCNGVIIRFNDDLNFKNMILDYLRK